MAADGLGAANIMFALDSIRRMRITLRMLRTSPLLDVLLGNTKQQILTVTLLQPERSWYFLELARHLRLRPSSLQRELTS